MAKELKSADKASQQMIKVANKEKIETVWDRYEQQQPQCGFGSLGLRARSGHFGGRGLDGALMALTDHRSCFIIAWLLLPMLS